MEELVLEMIGAAVDTTGGLRRATALARLVYTPADPAARGVEGRRYRFTAPLGPIEAERLRWYLEHYYLWPTGRFKLQAKEIEQKLPEWGKLLFDAALACDEARPALAAWQAADPQAERRFSVLVDSDLPEGSPEARQAAAHEAASELFSLPWELLHDDRGFLFHGRRAVRVRRRLQKRFRKIGVALEATPRDSIMLAEAVALARTHQAALVLLHVVEGAGGQWHGPQTGDTEGREDESYLQELAERLRADLQGQGVPGVEAVLAYGDVPRGIREVVRREGIDMLVVGGHGHRGLLDWLYGQTIPSIRHNLSIPIFAVRE